MSAGDQTALLKLLATAVQALWPTWRHAIRGRCVVMMRCGALMWPRLTESHKARHSKQDASGMLSLKCVLSFGDDGAPADKLNSMQVDAARNLLYVRGQVPGHKGNFVKVRDAVLKTFKEQPSRPVPTFLGTLPSQPLLAPKSAINPFE